MELLKLFKIRRKSDGKFSTGGSKPRFTTIGKMWRKQHLHSHLSMLKSVNRRRSDDVIGDFYGDCEIVTFKVIEEGSEDIRSYAASNTKL